MASDSSKIAGGADSAPLGLLAFATTLLVFSAANAKFADVTSAGSLALALAFGGVGLLLAGWWAFRNGDTFDATTFVAYGAFWIAFWYAGTSPFANSIQAGTNFAWFYLGWTILTAILLVSALRLNWVLVVFFGLLFLTFLLLTIGAFNPPGNPADASPIPGYLGLAATAAAYYLGIASLLRYVSDGKISLPVGHIGD
jgi:succinate-acetate transporter protein